MRKTFIITFLLVLVFFPGNAYAGQKVTINDRCPATLRLSSFEKAMIASLNNQELAIVKMQWEGKIVIIEPGTTGYIEDEQKVLGGLMEVVRFVYPLNPNGFYGVWTLKNCFDSKSQHNIYQAPKYHRPEYESPIGYLYVETLPENSKIRILNIRPKFYQGIKLDPGKYHIEVSATGYITKKKWIIMPADGPKREFVRLDREKIASKKPQKIKMVPGSSMVIHPNGIIYDPKTDLEWYISPEEDMFWSDARRWCEKLEIEGGGWRLPSIKELSALYRQNTSNKNIDAALKIPRWYIWSGDTYGDSETMGLYYNFYNREVDWAIADLSKFPHTFAVRSRVR